MSLVFLRIAAQHASGLPKWGLEFYCVAAHIQKIEFFAFSCLLFSTQLS